MKTSIIFILFLFLYSCATSSKPKNIVLLIGDGMGPQQVSLAESFARYSKYSNYSHKSLNMVELNKTGALGLSFTSPHGAIVTDSAASATHLATGELVLPEAVSVSVDGKNIKTILELAKAKGKATGVVTDTRVTHATPAAFVSHVTNRKMENEIAEQIIALKPDITFGGGLRHFLPQSNEKSKRKDNRDLIAQAQKNGINVVYNKDDLAQAPVDKPILGLFSKSEMPYVLEYKNKNISEPTLLEMTQKALDVLSQNPKGFFVMIEGGKIDWAGHANDAGTMLHELLHFDVVIDYVVKWAQKNKDTLVVLTGDHETGSFGFSYHFAKEFAPDMPANKNFQINSAEGMVDFGSYETLDHLFEQKVPFNIFLTKLLKEKPKYTNNDFCQEFNQISTDQFTLNECQLIIDKYKLLSSKEGHFKKDFDDTYYEFSSADNQFLGVIAKALAGRQNIVWGTGTHTATPVEVMSWGNKKFLKNFTGFTRHDKIGRDLIDLL